MKTFNVLDWPTYRYYSDSHPLYRWKKRLRDHGIKINFFFDHNSEKLKNADYIFIHSRYFENGWQNVFLRNEQNEAELINFLSGMKKHCSKLIWFDAADSTGSADFPIIHLVDAFVKKQVHTDRKLYTRPEKMRVWISEQAGVENSFTPCHPIQLDKIKVGWNIGLNDYRYFGYKLSRLSNYLSYKLYPAKFQPVEAERRIDLTFRGTLPEDNGSEISRQRNEVLKLMSCLKRNVATGAPVSKKLYRKELRESKLSISPFGWGEVCYRDFESFISGAVLIKPDMSHLETYPNIYKDGKTYLSVSWSLEDLKDKVDYVLDNYGRLKQIAMNGQQAYKNAIADGEQFVKVIKNIIA